MTQVVRVEGSVPAVEAGASARSLNIAEARENLTDLVNGVAYGKERLILMRRGKQLAALVPIADLETLRAIPIPGAAMIEVRQSSADAFTVTFHNGGAASGHKSET